MIPSSITIFLQCAILSLLVYGAYTDWKTRQVSHWITTPIILLSLPLIYANLSSITIWYHIIIIIYIIASELNYIGGADTRPLIAIIYQMNPFHLFIFFIAVTIFSIPFVRKKPNDIPLFIPIFLAYSLNTFIF